VLVEKHEEASHFRTKSWSNWSSKLRNHGSPTRSELVRDPHAVLDAIEALDAAGVPEVDDSLLVSDLDSSDIDVLSSDTETRLDEGLLGLDGGREDGAKASEEGESDVEDEYHTPPDDSDADDDVTAGRG